MQSGNSRLQNHELWGGSFFLDKLNALLVVLGLARLVRNHSCDDHRIAGNDNSFTFIKKSSPRKSDLSVSLGWVFLIYCKGVSGLAPRGWAGLGVHSSCQHLVLLRFSNCDFRSSALRQQVEYKQIREFILTFRKSIWCKCYNSCNTI